MLRLLSTKRSNFIISKIFFHVLSIKHKYTFKCFSGSISSGGERRLHVETEIHTLFSTQVT